MDKEKTYLKSVAEDMAWIRRHIEEQEIERTEKQKLEKSENVIRTYARCIKEYCKGRKCEYCIFYQQSDTDDIVCVLNNAEDPCYWDLVE